LKDWPAFEELRKKIDDFNEIVPLLELMANKAMKQRHWKRMEALTGAKFEVESDNFTLRNILEAPLLKHKEDIEVGHFTLCHASLIISVRSVLF
jgi:dynein heavy chain